MTNTKKVNYREGARLLLRLSGFMEGERTAYLFGKILASLEIINSIIFPFIFQRMIKLVTGQGGDSRMELTVTLGMLVLVVLLTPLICNGTFLSQRACIRGSARLKKAVFSHIQRLDVEKMGNRRVGDYLTVLGSDAPDSFRVFSGFGMKSLFRFAVVFPVTAVVLFWYSWQIAIVTVLFSFACIAISSVFNPKVSALSQDAKREMGSTANHLMELISGLSIVRIFGVYDRQREKFVQTCKVIFSKRVKYRTLNGIVDAFLNFFQAAAQPFTLILGLFLIAASKSDAATIVLVSSIAGVMADSARGVGTFLANIQPVLTGARRVFELFELETEKNETSTEKTDFNCKTALSIRNLTFAYPNKSPVLKDFSCEILAGETVAFVGASGCGKSTLFKLIQGFYTPSGGQMSYFGANREGLSKADIRSMISYVPQECNLFEGTIAYNISLGKLDATRQEIERAAKLAHLDNLIAKQKDGFETMVGEKGAKLSGGERQRIAIARAFLKDAPILFLDEATSALDADSEKEVLMALEELMKGRTTLVISHQETAVRKANRIIQMTPQKNSNETSQKAT